MYLIPSINAKIQAEISKAVRTLESSFTKGQEKFTYLKRLPDRGMPLDEVVQAAQLYKKMEHSKWEEGFVSGSVYRHDNALTELTQQIFSTFAYSNPLHPDIFPDVRRMEAEVVRMCCTMYHGDNDSCGTMTSGGTESIMLACKAYRDRAYELGIRRPEMVIPETAHAAFEKAAHCLKIGLRYVRVDPRTHKVDIKAMRSAIGRNTCMLVGSAPQFPHGIIDPIEEISKLGCKYKVPVHVDACLGGFLIPFMDKAGFPLPPFDFRLPGVTSISCDTHKYGFAPKGSSVVMYRNSAYRQHQFFVSSDWTGGVYATPTFAGSRSGAVVAVCWATLLYFGESGYVDATREIITATRKIVKGVSTVPGIFVMGDPDVSVVALGSDKFNIYRLSDALHCLGWHLNPLQFPPSIHLCLTHVHTRPGVAEKFVEDVRAQTARLLADPNLYAGGSAAIYGTSQSIPDRSLVSDIAAGFVAACYSTRDAEDCQ